MIRIVVTAIVSNYTLICLILGLAAAGVAILRSGASADAAVAADRLLGWYVFFNIGVMYLINFVFHVFFGQMAAAFIGWADSPFQVEVGTASLGFSIVGFLSAFAGFDRRLLAVIGPSIFMLGAAVGHVYQMVRADNFAPGNAGVIFYMDIFIPLLGFALLWWQHTESQSSWAAIQKRRV